MKTLNSILVLVFVLVSSISFAQPQGGGQRGGQQGPPPIPNTKQIKEIVKDLDQQLSLTDEQEETVLNLYTEHFKEIKQKVSGNQRPKREEMEALDKAFEKAIKTELTKEQQTKYASYLKKQVQQQPRQRR